MEAVRNAGEGGEVNVDIIIAPSNVPGTIKKKAPSTIRKSVKITAKSKQTTASKSKKVVKKKKIVESSDEDEAENDEVGKGRLEPNKDPYLPQPVGRLSLIVSSDRTTTFPKIVITLSKGKLSKIEKFLFDESTTT